jgi:hypothetical protein
MLESLVRVETGVEPHLKAAVVVPYDVEICKTYGRLNATLKTESGSDPPLRYFWAP